MSGTIFWVVIIWLAVSVISAAVLVVLGAFRASEDRTNDRALEEIVRLYLLELDNPAPDYTMRKAYRRWMAEHVGVNVRTDR